MIVRLCPDAATAGWTDDRDMSAGNTKTRRAETAAVAASASYRVDGENRPGGAGRIASRSTTIDFDGSPVTGDSLPGPADLLAAALAACVLKNVERFAGLLPFRYRRARVEVEIEREEPPPRIVRAHYRLRIETDEPEQRVQLLHRNIRRFGTITNTLAAACELTGVIETEPPTEASPGPPRTASASIDTCRPRLSCPDIVSDDTIAPHLRSSGERSRC